MTGATAFWAAVAGASLVFYALMTRLRNRERKRQSSGDSPATDGGNGGSEGGWSLADWFGGGHGATDASGNPVDFGGGDSGGADSGGGDGGGGGSSGD